MYHSNQNIKKIDSLEEFNGIKYKKMDMDTGNLF